MAKIVLTFNNKILEEYTLDKEYTTVGRAPDNDVVIDNLAVSGHHMRILTILNDSFVEDLGSTNGTFVNNRQVKKHALRNGDVVTVGKHLLRYDNEQASGEDEFERTMIIRPDAMGMPEHDAGGELPAAAQGKIKAELAESIKAQEAAVRTAPSSAKLQVITGANSGKELVLSKALTTIGKPGVQVAAISKRANGCFLIHVDGGPDNRRPKINEAEIGPKAQALENGDIIEVAGIKIQFIVD